MEKLTGIVIDVVRHSDRHNIVTLYTRTRGRVAFLSPVGTGRNARLRNARLSLLSEIESDVSFRPSASLQTLGPVALRSVYTDIYFNPVKSSLAIFLSEFLNRLLRTSSPDPNLYDYITYSLRVLDALEEGVADFHVVFLTSLLPFMGIQPDLFGYEPGDFFDMEKGEFVADRPLHRNWVGGEEAAFLTKLARISYIAAPRYHLNGTLRRRITSGLLQYYSLHYPGTDSLKSLPVLVSLFS